MKGHRPGATPCDWTYHSASSGAVTSPESGHTSSSGFSPIHTASSIGHLHPQFPPPAGALPHTPFYFAEAKCTLHKTFHFNHFSAHGSVALGMFTRLCKDGGPFTDVCVTLTPGPCWFSPCSPNVSLCPATVTTHPISTIKCDTSCRFQLKSHWFKDAF